LIAAIALIIVLEAFFVSAPLKAVKTELTYWGTIIGVWALIPSILSLWALNMRRAMRGGKTGIRAGMMLGAFVFVFVLAFALGGYKTPTFGKFYFIVINYVQGAVTYVLHAAYGLLYAYMLFKIDSLEAAIFIIPGLFYFLGKNPMITSLVWSGFAPIGDWIMNKMILGGTVGALIAATTTEIVYGVKSILVQEEQVILEA
jgi:hypothetical protein